MSSLKQLLSAFAMRKLRPPGQPAAGTWEVDLLAGIKETPYIGVCFTILLFILLLPTLVGAFEPTTGLGASACTTSLSCNALGMLLGDSLGDKLRCRPPPPAAAATHRHRPDVLLQAS